MWTLSTNETWNTSRKIRSQVRVPSGKTLTINSGATIRFASTDHIYDYMDLMPTNSALSIGIVVEPGGRLIIDNATLRGINECTGEIHMWDGITVKGNPALGQSPTSNQGYASISNATIMDARLGVMGGETRRSTTMGSTTLTTNGYSVVTSKWFPEYAGVYFAAGGGIISAYRTNFDNCYFGAGIGRYNGFSSNSIFEECDFKTSTVGMADPCHLVDENGSALPSNTYLTTFSVKGLRVFGNEFECATTFAQLKRSKGITSLDASLKIGRNCWGVDMYNNCVAGGPGNSFKNLVHGIEATFLAGFNTISFAVTDNVFENNNIGVKAVGSKNGLRVTSNLFKVPGKNMTGYYAPHGVHLNSCHAYNVYSNTFVKDPLNEGILVTGTQTPLYSAGVLTYNMSDLNNKVQLNTFTNIYSPLVALHRNGNTSTGLQYKCNTFSSGCMYDICRLAYSNGISTSIQNGTIRQKQGECIGMFQFGYAQAPASNRFYNSCYQNNHLYKDGSSTGQVYYNNNQSNTVYDPGSCINPSYTNNSCVTGVTNFTTVCPPAGGFSTAKTKLDEMNAALEGLDDEDEDYNALMTERYLALSEMAGYYCSIEAYDSAAWLLDDDGRYAEAIPCYMQAGLWSAASAAHAALPTGTDDDKMYAWLTGLAIDLYSIDSTWDNLDSMSRDSLGKIVQMDGPSSYLAGSLAEYLGIGSIDWRTPYYDSSFSTDTSMGSGPRMQPSKPTAPGISNTVTEALQFSLYPNPTNGNFIVESNGGRLSVMSIDGKVLKEYALKEGKVQVDLPPGLSAGIYVLKYKGDSGERIVRLTYQP